MSGMLRLVANTDGILMDIDCGTVISFSDNPNVSTTRVPIVTYTAENAFLFDTGATDSFTIQVARKNPIKGQDGVTQDIIDDSSVYKNRVWGDTTCWSNRVWKEALTLFINRWQARTDGCKLTYTPVVQVNGGYDSHDLYQRSINSVNVYIKSISFSYDVSSHELIRATLNINVGSMCGRQNIRW